MWYLILVACAFWGSCSAMQTEGDVISAPLLNMAHLYRDEPDLRRGPAWVAAMVYHRNRLKQNLNDTQKALHTESIAALTHYKKDVNNAPITRDAGAVAHALDGNIILFEAGENNEKPNILRPLDTSDNRPTNFVFCSMMRDPRLFTICAVDDNSSLHEWVVYLNEAREKMLGYQRYKEKIPGNVTAIRHTTGNPRAAIFFRDNEGLNRVGLAFAIKDAGSAFIPIPDFADVTHIEANLAAGIYRLNKADSSSRIYRTDGRSESSDSLPGGRRFLRRLSGQDAREAAESKLPMSKEEGDEAEVRLLAILGLNNPE